VALEAMKSIQVITFVAAAVGASGATPTVAEQLTGNQLMSYCAAGPTGFCLGYVTGYTQGILNWQVTDKNTCFARFPAGVTNAQTVLVIQNFLGSHPERLQEHADLLINDAIREAFPCK
jgi:hypothetical protein